MADSKAMIGVTGSTWLSWIIPEHSTFLFAVEQLDRHIDVQDPRHLQTPFAHLFEAFDTGTNSGQWKTIHVPLIQANFAREVLYNESNNFDLTQLKGFSVLVLNGAATDDATEGAVYIDDIKVVTVTGSQR
jgi:hypothetical protein